MRTRRDHSEKEIQESHAFLYVRTENEVRRYLPSIVSLSKFVCVLSGLNGWSEALTAGLAVKTAKPLLSGFYRASA